MSRVGRLNRSKVKVRVMGNSSFTWVELACNWGADVQTVVADNPQVTSLLFARLQVPTTTPALAIKLPPHGPWHGLLFATVRTLQDRHLVQQVFDAWLPGDTVLAIWQFMASFHAENFTRESFEFWRLNSVGLEFHSLISSHFSSQHQCLNDKGTLSPAVFSLDDTEGATQERVSFEPCIGQDYVGKVKLICTNTELPVYDSDGLAPDLGATRSSRFWFFWVHAVSVWSKGQKMLRPIKLHELFAIWDFEGKLKCRGKSHSQAVTLLQQHLYSPPGKLSRLRMHHLLDARVKYFECAYPCQANTLNTRVRSADVPFQPLEDLAEVRAKAACPDDAEIDISIWAGQNETTTQAAAWSVLRRLAVKWWASYHTKKALAWLSVGKHDKFDHLAVKDGLQRIQACRYFKWMMTIIKDGVLIFGTESNVFNYQTPLSQRVLCENFLLRHANKNC
eukprot:CCRYP_002219-RA/>CCRYP_002219-RA protein AED:0.38 eAED:0.42 QI:0/0/0/1/0.33/0.25/4/0/448